MLRVNSMTLWHTQATWSISSDVVGLGQLISSPHGVTRNLSE